jgi:DNA-binding MarR family transcriptional regulator
MGLAVLTRVADRRFARAAGQKIDRRSSSQSERSMKRGAMATMPHQPERAAKGGTETGLDDYRLDDQVGYLLRRVNQRHLALFAQIIPEVTTTQLAALARLAELGPLSQNQLGRATAMDAATIKGVVGRLVRRRLVVTVPSPEDRRRLVVGLTPEGRALFADLAVRGLEASRRTIDPLTPAERQRFLALLRKLL